MRKDKWDHKWVDYLFLSRAKLEVCAVLDVPRNPRKCLSPFGLPTEQRPSDHIPLVADIAFLDNPAAVDKE